MLSPHPLNVNYINRLNYPPRTDGWQLTVARWNNILAHMKKKKKKLKNKQILFCKENENKRSQVFAFDLAKPFPDSNPCFKFYSPFWLLCVTHLITFWESRCVSISFLRIFFYLFFLFFHLYYFEFTLLVRWMATGFSDVPTYTCI